MVQTRSSGPVVEEPIEIKKIRTPRDKPIKKTVVFSTAAYIASMKYSSIPVVKPVVAAANFRLETF